MWTGKQQVEIFCRDRQKLPLLATLFGNDRLSSPLIPDLERSVAEVSALQQLWRSY
ncbi:hypothetical protein [Chamaesiphon sp. OTE_20_metabat_361]|uniref:hypothetical protein n=1 Tax=Chamaesiphon sp. OTE_20_metabat_361 TaxID=2964689 RepID=UPI00286C6F04|nr:hypothetical protein [Chamaesiphon sp. OTE_20_metabat_361]